MLELTLPTMTCGHCVSVVTKAIKQADPRALVEIDLASHRVRVETTEERETIEAALSEAGYVPGWPTPGVSPGAFLRRSAPPSCGFR